MTVSEKAAYLKGLIEGMNYDTNSNEGKLFKAIAELLEDLSLSILDLEDEVAYLNDYIEEIDEDLGETERFVYDIDDDCDCGCGCEDDYCDDCDCDCDDCDCIYDDCDCCSDFDELICPACGEPIYIDDDADLENLTCPSCDTEIVFEEEEEIDG